MNLHSVSPTNPTYVTGAEHYRVTLSGILLPNHPHFAQMEEFFTERRQPEGYGLLFLESEEHSVTHAGPIDQVRAYQAAPIAEPASLDLTQGVNYGGWPHGTGWDDLLPATTWNPAGEGIVVEFDHPLGGKVTVYEYLKDGPDGTKIPRVSQHCEHCHPSGSGYDHEVAMDNRGPHDRRWMARNARKHVRHHAERCRPQDPNLMEIVTAVANEMHGTSNPVTSWESHCATAGPCAKIRHLRAGRA
ncbi:hypothetical protein ACIRPK_26570 [Kitasatospora sp. NPDC101801]|uniref:hypothetical protein n=1 Tax=Bacillati TaxID=1783272 RepID=UPI003810A2E6